MRLARSLAGYADVLDERNWITLSILAARVLGLTGACADDFLSRCHVGDSHRERRWPVVFAPVERLTTTTTPMIAAFAHPALDREAPTT